MAEVPTELEEPIRSLATKKSVHEVTSEHREVDDGTDTISERVR